MSDQINKKVIDIFSNKGVQNSEKPRNFAGFSYVKMTKDANGNKFNSEHLKKYAQSCHYIVRVMREYKGETVLYSYNVPNNELAKFIKSFEENTLEGMIIEIDKYFPEDLA